MRASKLLIFSVIAFGLAACGGGGENGGYNTGSNVGVGPAGEDPLAHCSGSGGNVFTNVSTDVGLCYSAPSVVAEEDIQQMGGGLAIADIDNDGMAEIYVAHGRHSIGKLFSYDGASFVEVPGNNGISPSDIDQAAYFVDINADGWKDFVSVQYSGIQIFMNDQTGHFDDATNSTNIFHDRTTYSMAAADYDLDGDVDLFFAHLGWWLG